MNDEQLQSVCRNRYPNGRAFLALANQLLSACGKPILPIESETVEQLVTAGITITTALAAWWKNNSFTQKALQADAFLNELKKRVR